MVGASRLVGLLARHIVDLALSTKVSTLALPPSRVLPFEMAAREDSAYLDGDITLPSLAACGRL